MGKPRTEKLDQVSFRCPEGHAFAAPPGRIEEVPEQDWHPWTYFAVCPECGEEATQAPWERGLLKGWARATGPRTPEGKAASAANLAGHPTPEEALRTRFNAMKTGLFARVATYFPARPGKYPHCSGCEHEATEACVPAGACLKRTELFLRHQIAFETRDPGLLTRLRGDTQAAIQALIDDMILAIAQDGGPRIKSPEWYYDKDGDFHLARYRDEETGEWVQLQKNEAHPLLKHLIDYMNKNSMTLADVGMTTKVQEQEEQAKGYLEQQQQRQENLLEFQSRQTQALEDLRGMIDRSRERVARDPVLIEHQAGDEE